MSDFLTASPNLVRFDPSKRVNYSLGQVLGVDEFKQEQTYFLERDRLQSRVFHGYGTIHGLQVEINPENTDLDDITVSSGMAVDPQGRYICVPKTQCGSLNKWLEGLTQEKYSELGSPAPLPIYVTLCYRECSTDKIPVLGGPCRTQEESMTDSRIAEDFNLRFSLNAPAQVEEAAIHKFGELLRSIEITDESDDPADFITEETLCNLVRRLPNVDIQHRRIHTAEAPALLQSAFRVWVTEVRGALLKRNHCGGTRETPENEQGDECVLLAKLNVGIEETNGKYQVKFLDENNSRRADVTFDETERPYLLSTRLLQEWMMFGGFLRETIESEAFATLSTVNTSTIRAWIHYPKQLIIERTDIIVKINNKEVDVKDISHDPRTFIHDIELDLKEPLKDTDQVVVQFDPEKIKEKGKPRSNLLKALEKEEDLYLYRIGNMLYAYLVIDWPALDDLSDVEVPAPGDRNVLTWDQDDSHWIAAAHEHYADPFATLSTINPKTLRAWIHYPEELSIPSDAISVIVNDDPVAHNLLLVPDPLFSGRSNTKILTINLPNTTLEDGYRVIVQFNTDEIDETDEIRGTQCSLSEALQDTADFFLYRHDNLINAYLVIDLPGLNDLSDVEAPGPDDGDVLTWIGGDSQRWEPSAHDHDLDSLTDVDSSAANPGDILVCVEGDEGNSWQPLPHELNNLSDVNAEPSDGDVLAWDQDQELWVADQHDHKHDTQLFATLSIVDREFIRVKIHFPEELDIPALSISVEINGNSVNAYKQNPGVIEEFEDPAQPGLIYLKPDHELTDLGLVVVRFDAANIQVVDGPSLIQFLEETDVLYLYQEDTALFAYLVVDWHNLDDLSDVNASSPGESEALIWTETDGWHPGTPKIGGAAGNDLSGTYPDPTVARIQGQPVADVAINNINEGDVLTWNNTRDRWEPRQSQAPGDFVQIPTDPKDPEATRPYAIIGAGYFEKDGSPIKPPFNELEVDRIYSGIYRLTTPYYPGNPRFDTEKLSYIVKASVINTSLLEAYIPNDEKIEINPELITPATIQISQLNEDEDNRYIEIWITQPILGAKTMQYQTVDLPFMVEISLYGFSDLREVPLPFPQGDPEMKKRLSLITATAKEIEALPHIGPVLARRIVELREALDRPLIIEDLPSVEGLSKKTVTQIRPQITVRE